MAKEQLISELNNILEKLEILSELGQTSTLRRAQSLLADRVNTLAENSVLPKCGGSTGGWGADGGWEPGRIPPFAPDPQQDSSNNGRRFDENFARAIHEIRSDDRRSSILLDPIESLISSYVDFFQGRTDVLEFRQSEIVSEKQIEYARSEAASFIQNAAPTVSIMIFSDAHAIKAAGELRALAKQLEVEAKSKKYSGFVECSDRFLEKAVCRDAGLEVGNTKWFDNGKVLKQRTRYMQECKAQDSCCWNSATTKPKGDWFWKEIWRDTGRFDNRPDVLPPLYVPHDWDNRCPFFESPLGQVSSDFGWRNDNGVLDFHKGIDIAVPIGTPVKAVSKGVVVKIKSSTTTGENYVIVKDGTIISQYYHIEPDAGLAEGNSVHAGMQLGLTGAYSRPHLHFAKHDIPSGNWFEKHESNAVVPCP